ncbi:MAG TPA: serine--tRNA ligase, partial [Streptosporangiaceae bacterium]|nr:serine--tRNA ligase [Streptosporangiaceae bacterium]
MIDLRAARHEPDRYRAALARRGADADFDALLAADQRWRELTERAEKLRAAQRRSSRGAPPSPEEIAELRQLRKELDAAETEQAEAEQVRQALLARIPNLPDPTAADGMAEEDSVAIRTWGER